MVPTEVFIELVLSGGIPLLIAVAVGGPLACIAVLAAISAPDLGRHESELGETIRLLEARIWWRALRQEDNRPTPPELQRRFASWLYADHRNVLAVASG